METTTTSVGKETGRLVGYCFVAQDGSSVKFKRLGKDNYYSWQAYMSMALEKAGLLKYVLNPVPKKSETMVATKDDDPEKAKVKVEEATKKAEEEINLWKEDYSK